MSRVSYGIMNPGGHLEMTTAVIDGLQKLISGAAEQAAWRSRTLSRSCLSAIR